MNDHKEKEIGDVCNYYGHLAVKVENGEAFWSIEDYNGHNWEAIPEFLYEALIRYENERA